MSTWAIGDLQGCRPEFERLLEAIRFDPATDRLWLCGDLVNRGGESLAVLRLVHQLGAAVSVTLGNHDLSLLAVAQRDEAGQARVNPDLRAVLFAPDRDVLLDWLRARPLLHEDRDLGWVMVHAGIAPYWTLGQARHEARAVERTLRGPGHKDLLTHMFGDRPGRWTPRLRGRERLRATINVLTRMRYCDVHGNIDFQANGRPGTQRPGLYPWFAVPGMKLRTERIVCGHWSSLGFFAGLGVHALDTGCVWGGRLTAMRLDGAEPRCVSVPAGPGRELPPPVRTAAPRRRRGRRGGTRRDGGASAPVPQAPE